MRITLRLDDDIHLAAKELAKAEGKTLGQVISSLARKTLLPETSRLAETEQDSDAGGLVETRLDVIDPG